MKNSGSCPLFAGGCFGIAAGGGGGLGRLGGGGGGGGGFLAATRTNGGGVGSSERLGYSLRLISRWSSSSLAGAAAAAGCAADRGAAAVGCEEVEGAHIALSQAGAALPSRLATHCCILKAGLPLTGPTTCAGEPATAVLGGTGFSTREPAATCAPLPTVMFPRIVAAAPIRTLSSTFGWRSPASLPVPPKVTFWRIETLSPTTAVSLKVFLVLVIEKKKVRKSCEFSPFFFGEKRT